MQIERIAISKIKPYEKNAKLHPQSQIEQIKKSIEMYGNNDPIAVWGKNNTIVEGHGRYLALKEMGVDEVEIIRLDHLTSKQRREYMLVHNKLTMNTDFDFDILADELGDLDFFLPPSDGWLIWDKRNDSGIRNTFADGEMAWCSFHTPVRIYHQLWNGMIREGEHEKRVHPTQKPVRMLGEVLKDFTSEGDIVVDVFGQDLFLERPAEHYLAT